MSTHETEIQIKLTHSEGWLFRRERDGATLSTTTREFRMQRWAMFKENLICYHILILTVMSSTRISLYVI